MGAAVAERVRQAGHVADWVATLADARAAFKAFTYDFVLLDLGLRDGNGRVFLREIRARKTSAAVMITTAMDQIRDRIGGLSDGADDYLVKPFDLNELIARIDAVARRYVALPINTIRRGDTEIDLARRCVSYAGNAIDLTAREWAVVELLARRPGAICSKEQIEDALYGLGEVVESNAIEVFVSRIRKKIGSNAIRTLRGRGYALAGSSEDV
ncbi:two component response regulator KdpE [Neokomagataea thailandica NBRC 106555]|uniref:Two component response regulator KdpE n=1 Tax=Neokomagataea thailandica NBRC 106555 TaxID=1223520 RepID=A0ABQ0QPE0_9PROT|nr:two component response regulator KdpE [Neokomagataea thailandica NBRC 106555]